MIMWALSDRAIPRSYRMMQGFGVNTFVLVNEARVRTFVKFHWRPVLGVHSLTWDECLKINGTDPDFHRRDLYEAIQNGAFPEYEFGVQLIPEEDEDKYDFDILDCTKLIPEELVPVKWIGKMVLNRVPDEFFTEVEQVAFCTQHVVPGIDFSNDPMLQGRNFSYQDTQLSRLGGPNWQQIPINRPICPVMNFQRDGFNQRIINPGKINYWPNRQQLIKPGNATANKDKDKDGDGITHDQTLQQAQPTEEQKEVAALRAGAFVSFHEKMVGMKCRLRAPKFQEHFNQAELFYQSMSGVEKLHITSAAIFELGHVDDIGVRQRMVERFNLVSHQFAVAVAQAIGVPAPHPSTRPAYGKTSPVLSQLNTAFASIKSRKVAILLADGYDQAQVAALYTAIKAQAAIPQVVSTRKGTIYSSNHKASKQAQPPTSSKEESVDFSAIDANWSIFTSKSVLFDSTIVVGGSQSVQTLSQFGETTGWLAETFKHHKAILGIGEAITLLQQANLDRLSNIDLATDKTAQNAVQSHGVVTVMNWSATAPPQQGAGEETKVGAVIQAVTTAVTSAVGAATGGKPSDYMPNDAAAQFFDAMKLHRDWTRDVTRIPA
jgi:catalase